MYFDGSTGVLNMTVCNRSNDIVWGAYGANAVHMSFLQEVIAAAVGLPLGSYVQFSNNFHAYIERPDVVRLIENLSEGTGGVLYKADDRYLDSAMAWPVNVSDLMPFLAECERVAEDPTGASYTPSNGFLRHVVGPMMRAHQEFKYGDYKGASYALAQCRATDWRIAASEWLERRILKAAQ